MGSKEIKMDSGMQLVIDNKESGVTNDPNDWAAEHNAPQYIINLLLSVFSVSMKTVCIVEGLPRVEWE